MKPSSNQQPRPAFKYRKQTAATKTNQAGAEPVFRPPEAVAAEHEKQPVSVPKRTDDIELEAPRRHFHLHWPPSRDEYIGGAVVVILAAIGVWGFVVSHQTAPKTVASVHRVTKTIKKPAAPTTVPSTLTGLPVDPSANQRPVTGVMIENSLDARPQAGLSQAGVVFEAVAEGGVTRFLALFQDQVPTTVGPVRSARPYYLQWDMGFDAPLAHVGGSPDALNDIKSWGVKNLDEFANAGAYHRVSSRPAPHNMYTGIDQLNQLEASKGYTSSNFSGFPRKKDAAAKQPTAVSISFNLSGNIYNPTYSYSAATNSYARSEGGSPQTDANSGTQLSPKVVIAIVVPLSRGALDASGAYYSNYNPIGSGQAYVFQDGTVTIGQWSKPSATSQIGFSDASGQPLKLNAGQTWISAVTDTGKISYH